MVHLCNEILCRHFNCCRNKLLTWKCFFGILPKQRKISITQIWDFLCLSIYVQRLTMVVSQWVIQMNFFYLYFSVVSIYCFCNKEFYQKCSDNMDGPWRHFYAKWNVWGRGSQTLYVSLMYGMLKQNSRP